MVYLSVCVSLSVCLTEASHFLETESLGQAPCDHWPSSFAFYYDYLCVHLFIASRVIYC